MTALKKVEKNDKINPKDILKRKSSILVQQELEEKGVDFFMPEEIGGSLHIDKDYLSLPQNITEVTSRDLGEYLNAFTQQKMYIRTLVGYAELKCEESRRKYYAISEQRYRELLNSKLSETAKEREINSDENVIPYYDEYVDFKNKIKLLNFNILSLAACVVPQ